MQNPAAAGTFSAATTSSVGNGGTSAVAIADLNGDGKADLIATSSGVSVYLQDPMPPGSFLSPANYAAGAQPIIIAVRDLNGDGRPDLAIANLGTRGNCYSAPVPGEFGPALTTGCHCF
jgi:hypothetical protein